MIYTKWHKVVEKWGRVSVRAPAAEARAPDTSMEGYVAHMKKCEEAPKFYVDPELMEVWQTGVDSIEALNLAGVLRLPYPVVMIEFEVILHSIRHFVLLEEVEDEEYPFRALLMTLRDDRAVFSACHASINIAGRQWNLRAGTPSYLVDNALSRSLANDALDVDGGICCIGLEMALVLMHTRGIEREKIEPTRLNKARLRSGKASIPAVTTLRIGHYYDSSGKVHQHDARKPVKVHWRRGHVRNVAVGKGRTGREPRYIPPTLVNYRPGDAPPVPRTIVKW